MTGYMMVAIGGALGALARYELALAVQSRTGGAFPYGTLVVNVVGCLLMGVVMTILTERVVLPPQWRYLVPIGFLGAFTTFSTFEYETFKAAQEGAWHIAAANVLVSVVLGFAALWAGIAAVRHLP
jgi:fluoride exporter